MQQLATDIDAHAIHVLSYDLYQKDLAFTYVTATNVRFVLLLMSCARAEHSDYVQSSVCCSPYKRFSVPANWSIHRRYYLR